MKKMKIIAGVLATVVWVSTPIFNQAPDKPVMISEWDRLNNSLFDTSWQYEESEVIENTEIEEYSFKEFTLPKTRGFKSYMSYTLFSKSSKQYKLQQYAETNEYGLRTINGRFCVAVGTHYFENREEIIGTYIDAILDNGTVIECVVGDIKADIYTDLNNIVTLHNGCVCEFICDSKLLHKRAKKLGDVSCIYDDWDSSVEKIIVYERNVFNEK